VIASESLAGGKPRDDNRSETADSNTRVCRSLTVRIAQGHRASVYLVEGSKPSPESACLPPRATQSVGAVSVSSVSACEKEFASIKGNLEQEVAEVTEPAEPVLC
jgi:hypothetical protein